MTNKNNSNQTAAPPHRIPIEFIEPDGNRRRISALPGQNLMDAALDARVKGLGGQCGGAINCATCLCDIEPGQRVNLPNQHADELELLEWVDEASTKSRLTCQLLASSELRGLVLRVVSPSN